MRHRLLTAAVIIIASWSADAQEIRARGEITVERVLVDAHITDHAGNPILGLTPKNFDVRIDGRRAQVEAVDWIEYVPVSAFRVRADEAQQQEISTRNEPTRNRERSSGRFLVFFFQTDFSRHRARGQMRMIAWGTEMLESLLPEDRVAVVQFDSHLKIRLDFTSDKEKILEAMQESLLIDTPPPTEPDAEPSLARHLDLVAAKRAASPERALMLLGKALQKIDGQKSLVFFAWGLGRNMGRGIGVQPTYEYRPAKRALAKARTAVFTLDIVDAPYHSLEVGLKQVSHDTGGFYVKTFELPRLAIERLHRTISGRYELVIKKPPSLARGDHELSIRLKGRRGIVLARSNFRD